MKYLYLSLIVFLLPACSTLDTFTTWISDNDESMVIVRIATAEAIYNGDEHGSPPVCSRVIHANEIIRQARGVLDNDVLSLVDVDTAIAELITGSGLNPATSAILLEIAIRTVNEHRRQAEIGAISQDARITLNSLLDAADSTVKTAGTGC